MKTAYLFDSEVSNFHFGPNHPMKPHRVAATHSLVYSYNLDKKLDIIQPKLKKNIKDFLLNYHTEDYIESLSNRPTTDDCPCFPGIEEYCFRYSLASLTASHLINYCNYETVINWSGGLHHAKKSEPSGFCYTNDIVLCIQGLLQKHERVMYIDIDIHHGDGVEEAFFTNPRVMTVSFHKYGECYFPGTGSAFIANRSVTNVPLKTGIDDASYKYIFEPVVEHAVKKFNPCVIVMQCGADSLAGDRIGCFNLSVYGHGECVKFVKKLNRKLVVLGGGGYKLRNVSRCWAYETSILCDSEIENALPENDIYRDIYKDDCFLHTNLFKKYENLNTRFYLDIVKGYVMQNLDRM